MTTAPYPHSRGTHRMPTELCYSGRDYGPTPATTHAVAEAGQLQTCYTIAPHRDVLPNFVITAVNKDQGVGTIEQCESSKLVDVEFAVVVISKYGISHYQDTAVLNCIC